MLRPRLQGEKLRRVVLYLVALGWLLVSPVNAAAQFKAWVMARLPDTPEGLAIDSKGNLYATLVHLGEVVMLKEDGSYDHVAWVPSKEESGKGRLLGLDSDKDDNLYVAYEAHSKYDATDLDDPFHAACRDATVTRLGALPRGCQDAGGDGAGDAGGWMAVLLSRRCVARRAGQRVYDRSDVLGHLADFAGWKKGGAVVGAPPA